MEQQERCSPLEQFSKGIKMFETLAINQECRDKLWRYDDAFRQSLFSILDDPECDADTKIKYFNKSIEQYTSAMKQLFPQLVASVEVPITPAVEAAAKSVDKSATFEEIEETESITKSLDQFDEIEEIEKFNPYHDRLGRFATAGGATSFTYKPGQGAMYDNAIAREKERTKDMESKKPKEAPKPSGMYPADIAGVKRGEPMTREQADQGKANPNYDKGGGYYTNCQTCVVAYEARRRGYDVIAKANTRGSKLGELARESHAAWKDPKTGDVVKRPMPNESVKTPKQCRTMLEDTIQPGERYTFAHGWKGRGRSGHIICADKDESGKLRLFDPQNGKTMQGEDIDSYLNRVKYTATFYGTKVNVGPRLLRVDNKEFNMDYANKIMEATAS